MPNYLKLAAESAIAVFGVRSIYEQPRYEVIARLRDEVEVRRYGLRLAAEVTVAAASERDGRNAAFSVLAGYIFGKNRRKAEIAMTAPVATAGSQEIAMTAPVETARSGPGSVTQRFFLPSSLTRAIAPEPDDPRIRVIELPEETLAAVTFSGFADERTVEARRSALLAALSGSRFRPTGPIMTMFYDPPFTIPFLRRNEVAVRVTASDA
jgi:hypothetical protein